MNESIDQELLNGTEPVIMLVDDEEMVLQSLSSYLKLETDYQVLTFKSPSEALKALKRTKVDLVISDFLMPEMNGLEFLAQVKAMYPEVSRILLTGYADKENAIKAINEVGLFQYIEKPWDNDSLKLIIRNGITNKSLKEILEQKIRDLDQVLLERDGLALHNETIKQELTLAQKVQESLLPHELPDFNGITLMAKYQPALEIGGDFYDIVPLAHDRVAVLLADVTGHGIQAALSTMLIKSAITAFNDCDATPGEILSHMNAVLYNSLPPGTFVAALAIVLDPATNSCRLVNGGIPYPYLVRRKTCEVELIPVNGLLLGVSDAALYQPGQERRVELREGDCLVTFTDGITEAENEATEHFEYRAMHKALLDYCNKSGQEFLEHLLDAARKFSKSGHRWDDVTILTVERKSK
ncbi:MAG: SpoIIE family protein phosphatase [bacterium]